MIKFIKLLTGDELVAVTTEQDTHFYLEWPARVVTENNNTDPTKQGPQTRVEPYTPFVKGHCIYVPKNRVVYIADPIPSLAEYYEKNYGTLAPSSTPITVPVDAANEV